MNIAFAGTPAFAAIALEGLLNAGFRVPLVLTQPDRARGRGQKCQPSPVKAVAMAHGLCVHQPETLKTLEAQAPLKAAAPDVLVVVAYGLLLPQAVLDIPRHHCINVHASLLPRWRGAAPIHRAIEAGDTHTGIGLMKMEAGLDTGPLIAEHTVLIDPQDTTATLHDRLAAVGARLLVTHLPTWVAGGLMPKPQSAAGIVYAAKIQKAEAFLNWEADAPQLERQIRAFNPFPVAQGRIGEGILRIWEACVVDSPEASAQPGEIVCVSEKGLTVACGQRALCLTQLQRPGGRVQAAAQVAQALGLSKGARFALPSAADAPI